ncbi:MAG TPA: DJ-1 family glyoxalase III [Steroidobacteraceae bacterium]|nr:DJ-1 family glyoxalase III [Steroidobacteraceae bacterium]
MARVIVPLAEGFEEIEAITVIDLLRRAGIEVRTAALVSRRVTGSHGIAVEADGLLEDLQHETFDMIVLPGGMPGADNLKNDPRVLSLLRSSDQQGRYVAAICAAPGVLAHAGLLEGRTATSFPGFLSTESAPGISLSDAPVVSDGRLVTSRGPGTAMDFALALVELLEGRRARLEVESRLQRPG